MPDTAMIQGLARSSQAMLGKTACALEVYLSQPLQLKTPDLEDAD